MPETYTPKAENPTSLPICVQPEQPDAFRLSDRTVATPSPLSASAEPDQFHQSAHAIRADPDAERCLQRNLPKQFVAQLLRN